MCVLDCIWEGCSWLSITIKYSQLLQYYSLVDSFFVYLLFFSVIYKFVENKYVFLCIVFNEGCILFPNSLNCCSVPTRLCKLLVIKRNKVNK